LELLHVQVSIDVFSLVSTATDIEDPGSTYDARESGALDEKKETKNTSNITTVNLNEKKSRREKFHEYHKKQNNTNV
jgi:hypothetical protein